MQKYNEIYKPLKIRDLELENNIILAPMAGITDMPFRIICKEMGVGLVYTELISAKGILYNNKNTNDMLKINEKEMPVVLQIFGSDPKIIGEIVRKVDHLPFSMIDLNSGCPAPKVVKNNEGSALMKDGENFGNIIYAMRENTEKPVSVKIRKGFNYDNINAVEIAKIAEKNGADLLAIHGRTREEYYSGVADWDIIKEVKENLSIPVIANGDIVDGISAKKALEYTGADGIMIGRGSQGNPFIFQDIISYLKDGVTLEKRSRTEVCKIAKRHTDMLCEYRPERIAVKEMRKHLAWYSKGYRNSQEFRAKVNMAKTKEEIFMLIDEFEREL
ncbi:MAG: tRNA dihydrouridine synthase DusB [Lachnospirales bacterium]